MPPGAAFSLFDVPAPHDVLHQHGTLALQSSRRRGTMLTIMQKQSKMMEVELKNKKQALLEARASLEAKTARVVELEEQLEALAPTDEERAEEQQVVIHPSRLVVSVRDRSSTRNGSRSCRRWRKSSRSS